ncbi:MAG: type II secretion system protein, partial [Clostridium paraputrificum]
MKKGYTLIELVAVMLILGIIFSFSFSGYNLYKSFEENIKVENFLYELEDTFCYGRDYCKNNGVIGTIKLREYEDKFVILFSSGGDTKIKRELEKSIMIDNDYILAYPIVDSYDISKYGIVQ